MFYQTVDKRRRQSMIAFLENHFRYWTTNGHNKVKSYANNVKLPNLKLPKEYEPLAYEVLTSNTPCPEWDEALKNQLSDFQRKTGYHAGFNGRSSGYLVLYPVNKTTTGVSVDTWTGIDMDTDFSKLSIKELKERTVLVQEFDKLCDSLRDTFLNTLFHMINDAYKAGCKN